MARSQDLAGWVLVLVTSMLLPTVFHSASGRLTGLFASVAKVMANPSPEAALGILEEGLRDAATIILIPLAGLALVALAANIAQTGFMFSLQAAKPKFDHVNPLAGIKRLFSPQSLWTLLKQSGRLAVLSFAAYGVVSGLGRRLVGTQPVGLGPIVGYAGTSLLGLVREVAVLAIILSLVDYAVQRRRIGKQLKMTKHEIKEETKQSEGDPVIKGAVRRRQMKLSRARMMAAVIGADVIVTNPTHYAVALRYEAGSGRAPKVVAKGADEMALSIRNQAKKHGVPIVEDPPLARAVFGVCEIDDHIPTELYVAVARLLAFVFTLPTIVRRSGVVHRRPTSALIA